MHFSWAPFFISTITRFVVWDWGTAGYIDEVKSEWLRHSLGVSGGTARGTRTLIRIAQEADCFDEAFFVSSCGEPRRNSSSTEALQLAA